MTIRFTALAVDVDDNPDDDYLSVCVAETVQPDDDSMFLMFQCGLSEPQKLEIWHGHDTHCVVTPDQGTAYGAVEEIALRGKVLYVKLAAKALADLDLDDPEIEVYLDVEDDVIAEFRAALRRVMTSGRPDARPSMTGL